MKKIVAVLLAMALVLSLTLGAAIPVATASIGNHVGVNFETVYIYFTADNSISNISLPCDVTAALSGIHNDEDGIGESVVAPTLTFSTSLEVFDYHKENLVSIAPYTWELPDIPQSEGQDRSVTVIVPECSFQPGFSANLTFDQVTFTTSGTQTLTITATPQEEMNALVFWMDTVPGNLVNATITSPTTNEAEGIWVSEDARRLDIVIADPVVGKTYASTITIDVQLKPGVASAEYSPRVNVWGQHILASGDLEGNTVSRTTELGTFIWQTADDYSWHWSEKLTKVVVWSQKIHCIVEAPTQDAINEAIDKGLTWLRTQQHGDGSWYWAQPGEEEQPSVGMTGLSVWSLLHGLVPQTDPQVQDGIDFILSQQRLDPNSDDYGAVYSHQPTYETAIAILALRATNNPVYLPQMTLAADYLVRSQNDDGVEYPNVGTIDSDNPAYGGWSYNYASEDNWIWVGEEQVPVDWYARADLSCTQFAMIGLKAAQEAGVPITEDTWVNVWEKAQTYVTRCQNPDGGFTYQPQDMPGGGGNSYGSMTAGGVWCLALTGVPVEDTRVQDGLAWLDCNYFYDRNPPGGTHNHYYFLWSAAKAFTHYGRPPELVEGTWYYDYAGYLLANQGESGEWTNPQWEVDMGDRESHLNRTGYALLILEKAVLPPPPGIDFIEVDLMKILFDRSPNRDKMEIKAHFQLAEGASYNLDEDDVIVTIGGVVITIPPGSFVGSAGKYEFKSDGEPKVGMKLDFNNGEWSLKVGHIDASAIDSSDGIPVVDVNVTLMIGYMLAGQNVPTWCNDLVYP